MALVPGLCSALTPQVVETLKAGGVASVLDFIAAEPETLAQDFNLAYKDVCSILRVLLAEHSSLAVPGSALYQGALNELSILHTSYESLDCLLDGGIYTGELTEIAGGSGSGKTKLCLQILAATVIGSADHTVAFIDSGGSLDVQALVQALDSAAQTPCQSDHDLKQLTERIQVFQAGDVFELCSVLHSIRDGLTLQTEFFKHLRLLVVDNISSIIRSVMRGGDFPYSQAMVCQIGLKLKEIASSFSVAVVDTNRLVSQYGDGAAKLRVALGHAWSYVPHTQILLHRLDEDKAKEEEGNTAGGRGVLLVKSRRQETTASETFSLGRVNWKT